MADNTTLNTGSGGDTIRTEDRTTFKTPVSLIDVGGTSAEAIIGDSGVAMPVRGMAQDGNAVAGNPVPAGGRYDATPRTLDDGDRGELALDATGKVLTVESSAAAIKTAVETIDNAIAGNEMQVDVVTSALPTGASTLAEQQTQTTHQSNAATSLAILDDWDETDRAKVNLIAGQAGITGGAGAVGASTPRVTLASDDPVTVAAQLIDDAIVADDAAFTPATTKVMMAGYQADETATDSVNEGDAGAARMTLDRKQIVTLQPHTAGGCSVFRSIDLDETEEQVKATAGCLYGYYISNMSSGWLYLKFYNDTAANVVVGTTTPYMTLPVPAGVSGHVPLPVPVNFDTAITAACTTGIADNNTGAPGANEFALNAYYL